MGGEPGAPAPSNAPAETGMVPPMVRNSLIFLVFATTNFGLNEFNPWVLKEGEFPGFSYPAFYGMWHMLVSSGAAMILMLTVARPPTGLPSVAQLMANPGLFAIAMCDALNVGLNNMSLIYVALFVNQVIKSCQPLPTIIFEMIIAKKRFSAAVLVSVCCIVVGALLAPYYMISHDSNKGSTTMGIISVVVAMLATSLKPVISMVLMQGIAGQKEKLAPTLVLFYATSLSFCFMLTFWLISGEREPSINYLLNRPNRTEMPWLEGKDATVTALGCITVGSLMAFSFNLSVFYYIMYTSALVSTVSSLALKILILCVSAVQAGVRDPISLTGIAIVTTSTLSYAYFSHRDAAAKRAEADANAATKSGKEGLEVSLVNENTRLVKP